MISYAIDVTLGQFLSVWYRVTVKKKSDLWAPPWIYWIKISGLKTRSHSSFRITASGYVWAFDPVYTPRHQLYLRSCVCFSWLFRPLPPCKLTAIVSHCQPTLQHTFFLFYLLAASAMVSKLFLFTFSTLSWKLILRQMSV